MILRANLGRCVLGNVAEDKSAAFDDWSDLAPGAVYLNLCRTVQRLFYHFNVRCELLYLIQRDQLGTVMSVGETQLALSKFIQIILTNDYLGSCNLQR